MFTAPGRGVAGALDTDLYQLTMVAGHWRAGRVGSATFDLFVRRLPPQRGYLIAAGLAQALDYLECLQFHSDEIAWLRRLPNLERVGDGFFTEFLPSLRFTGDVWAMPEGTPVFANEPLLRVTAPIAEAQLVETALLATVAFQTSIASKAARIVRAAQGRPVVEFGTRRAHGPEAGLLAARAACVAGCSGSSNVAAARLFGLTPSGTMAHSWVLAHGTEVEAFRAYGDLFADRSVFLLDTYDTLAATDAMIAAGLKPAAVRIDSGDLLALSREVRRRLDAAGWTGVGIFGTSDLDEHAITELLANGAPVDGFGVGTSLATSIDAPALSAVYKLAEVERDQAWVAVAKRSPGKYTWPGRKQVWRTIRGGAAIGDTIGLVTEPAPAGSEPLLAPVMRGGRRLAATPPVSTIRDASLRRQAMLSDTVRRLHSPETYDVQISAELQALAKAT